MNNNARLLLILEPLLATWTFISTYVDEITLWIKILSFVLTLAVAIVAIITQYRRGQQIRIETKIKEQEYQRMRDEYIGKFGVKQDKKKK